MLMLHLYALFAAVVVPASSNPRGCDRSRSRLVRKVVYEKLMPAFSDIQAEFSDECLFSPARDCYRTQEAHKSVEEGSKWYCHFCGKAFLNEHFLDLHFDNRHSEQVEEERSVCLADACEVFRCDVVSGRIIPDFWDVALCLEDDMKHLYQRCEAMVKSCVPSGLKSNDTRMLTEVTTRELCSYLTCSKYWEIPFEDSSASGSTGIYIILTILILCAVIIYYCIFFTYYFTDTFSDSIAHDPTPRTKNPIKPFQPDLRQRPRPAPISSPHPH